MAKVREAVAADLTSPTSLGPKVLGRRLKQVRAERGLSRRQAARSAGLTRHELAGYERGRTRLSSADLASIAGSCGVDPTELLAGVLDPAEATSSTSLLPERDPLRVGADLGFLAVGDHYVGLAAPPEIDDPDLAARALLAEYLDLIAALRSDPLDGEHVEGEQDGDDHDEPVTPGAVREPDLVVLADALERSPEDVEALLWPAPETASAATMPLAPPPTTGLELLTPSWRFGTVLATAASSDRRCSTDRGGVRWALAEIPCVGALTIEATVDLTGGPGFGLLFRAGLDDRSRLSGYSVDIDIDVDGAYVLRHWEHDRQHWWPLAHAAVADPATLFGRHLVRLDTDHDELHVAVDGLVVLSVPDLHSCTTGAGVLPVGGDRAGFAVWGASLLTVDSFRVTHR